MRKEIPPWLFGVTGYVLAFACCLPFVRWGKKGAQPSAVASHQPPEAPAVPTVASAVDTGSFPTEPAGWLAFGQAAGTLSRDDCAKALDRILELPESERQTSLTLLLLRWLDSDPGAAVLWCQEHLEGIEHRTVLKDLATTWAHRDSIGLAHWWAGNMPDSEVFSGGSGGITGVLARTDPIAYATYMDIPRLHKIRSGGVIENETIPNGDQLPAFARRMIGQVGYETDRPEALRERTLERHLPGKSGWNHLFEKVAVRWHEVSPAACEAWLSGFSEEAQIAARHRIGKGWR
ncbi:MAG: hypothetical protein AAF514_11345 [Verrucomicrobiota bacterium]